MYSIVTKNDEDIKGLSIKEKEDLSKFEYIDYMGYYNENDLKVERVKFGANSYSEYIKISGLKDKELETKLNNIFQEDAYKLYNETGNSVYYYLKLNAFNILSFYYHTRNSNDEPIIICHNIDLTTGEEIKMQDILNEKNITRQIAYAYYNKAISYVEVDKQKGDEYYQPKGEYMAELEDNALKYARNAKNNDFVLTSAGLFLVASKEDFKLDRQYYLLIEIPILTRDNPRLFNYYYKYKTNETIFDGSYTGKKNILYADYEFRSDSQILDYAIVYNVSRTRSDFPTKLFDDYLNSLDKSNFYYIDNFSILSNYLKFDQCTMAKEYYNNNYKKHVADTILSNLLSYHSYIGTRYTQDDNASITCEYITLYSNNPNVYVVEQVFGGRERKIVIKNNPEKMAEINNYLKTKLNELGDSAFVYFSNITSDNILIKISYINNGIYEYLTKNFSLIDKEETTTNEPVDVTPVEPVTEPTPTIDVKEVVKFTTNNISYANGMFNAETTVNNTSDTNIKINIIIHVKDKDGNELFKMPGYIGDELKAHETKTINSYHNTTIDGEFSKDNYIIEYEITE